MNDEARRAPALSDTGRRIPIKDVLPLRDAGLPRDIRSLQRYCENGLLDGLKELTATGETWFVALESIEPAIIQLKQMHAAKGARPTTTSDVVSSDVATEFANSDRPATDGPGSTASDNAGPQTTGRPSDEPPGGYNTAPDMSLLVEQFEKRLADRDEEIHFYREELQERRAQIRDMKSIIDGQNGLLSAINRSSEKIFTAIAQGSLKSAEPDSDPAPKRVHVIETRSSGDAAKNGEPAQDFGAEHGPAS